jgi:hypothetical protein
MSDVSKPRNEYNATLPLWEKARDAEAGGLKIKAGNEKYLPKPSGIDVNDYKNYVDRAVYYNFTGRTADGLKGMLFRKPPIVKFPDAAEDYNNSVSQDGQSLIDFTQDVVKELINPSRCGILLDAPNQEGENITVAQAEEQNLKPYLCLYNAESIINWRTETINNKSVLSMCVLVENIAKEDTADKFKLNYITQYRVLELVDGVYTVSIYKSQAKNSLDKTLESATFETSYVPRFNGETLDYIPFWILGVNGVSPDITNAPVMLDLIDVNIAHYRNSADNENALHWNGTPTLIVSGWPEDKPVVVGGAIGVPTDANVQLVEPTAGGLLPDAMVKKQNIMAILGANLITSEAQTDVTATSTLIQHQGDTATISDIGQTVSRIMTEILKVVAEALGESPDDVSFALNLDFNPKKMTGADALALVQVWQSGGIDKTELNYNFKQGEIIRANRDEEEMEANIEQEQNDREQSLLSANTVLPNE